MKNILIDHFSKFAVLKDDEIIALKESMVIKHFPKGGSIIKEGQHNVDTFFVLEGLVRQYKLKDDEEITTNFFTIGQWIIALTSFAESAIAADYLVCVEDTTVVVGNEQRAQELFKKFPRFETISRAVMETVFAEQQKKMEAYLTDTPEQRYRNLLMHNPTIVHQVPLYHIASYIGVKPESLSRIRKRIASNG